MATIRRFEDLVIWQDARKLAKEIFIISSKENFKNDFGLINQIRDSSGSVMDNIAEGFDRGGRKEFGQFLSISKGSLGECKSQLYKSFDRKYISEDILNSYLIRIEDLSRKIFNTMEYLKNTDIKGIKYKNKVEEPIEDYIIKSNSARIKQPQTISNDFKLPSNYLI